MKLVKIWCYGWISRKEGGTTPEGLRFGYWFLGSREKSAGLTLDDCARNGLVEAVVWFYELFSMVKTNNLAFTNWTIANDGVCLHDVSLLEVLFLESIFRSLRVVLRFED
jgi:hypothetical protein